MRVNGSRQVLVVDDEEMVREVVVRYLERDGFVVTQVADGQAALDFLEESSPDLVILDLMLPKVQGVDVLRAIRKVGNLPVILLSARAEESDRVAGLELGADDYVVKPFSPRELAARVRTVLRRSEPQVAVQLDFGELVIDQASREITVEGRVIDTAPKEFDLLIQLAAAPRTVFSRAELLEKVWDSSVEYQDPSTVTVHMRRLRQKIEHDPNNPRWLTTVWGVGYRFDP